MTADDRRIALRLADALLDVAHPGARSTKRRPVHTLAIRTRIQGALARFAEEVGVNVDPDDARVADAYSDVRALATDAMVIACSYATEQCSDLADAYRVAKAASAVALKLNHDTRTTQRAP